MSRQPSQPPHKNTKGAGHHYFPRTLQKAWRDDDGWVTRLACDGSIKRSKNGTFGHVRNAHHIKISDQPSVWDETFEHTFNAADTSIPHVLGLLSELESPESRADDDWVDRFTPQWHLKAHRKALAELVASLVVRSPNLRNLIRVMVTDFWDGEAPHWPGGEVPGHLISFNQKHELERFSKALAERGKFVILLSNCREFIFGDGMLHNFSTGGPVSPNNPKCVVPLTPAIAIAYNCPLSYTVSADFVSVSLTPREVEQVNEYTLIYSGQYIFFRNERPRDLTSFELGRHQKFQYHRAVWLDGMMDAAANARFDSLRSATIS